MSAASRRSRLTGRFGEIGVDAVLVTRLVNVRYLTGFTGSSGQLLVIPEGGVFLTDSRYEEQARREVPDLRRVVYPQKLAPVLAAAAGEEGVRRIGFEVAGLTYRSWRELEDIEGIDLVPIEDDVERLRWAKDPGEIALVERAQRLTDEAFDRVIGKLSEG
ncbi:MAG: aminopeptidase P family N-terminal domain-containing protein, partial [Actinomycetota bacterium]